MKEKMYCKKCGQKLNEGAVFCGNCGASVGKQGSFDVDASIQKQSAGRKENGNKKAVRFIVPIVAVIVLAGIGVGAVLIYNNEQGEGNIEEGFNLNVTLVQGTTEETDKETGEELSEKPLEEATLEDGSQGDEQTTAVIQETENTEADTGGQDETDAYAMFNIAAGTEENYASATNPNNYQYYNSGIANFHFFYPAELYSGVNYSEQETESAYGINLRSLAFSGSAGSELIFTLSRYEGESIESKTEEIYNLEMSGILDAGDIVHGTYEDHGRFIVTGYTQDRSKLIYDLFNVDSEYVMQMKVIFPAYQDVEDKLQKDYVTECLYRLCGFSGSKTNCRSYETYKSETYGIDS
ncbi:MAG: zinc-ribbon domain-containing protein [Clostridiales bacterium]|nr:zinc-ribbon domain-containing protein [Clostridiales bacterium]